MRLCGGKTNARSTIDGRPFSSRSDTSASPTPSSVITFLNTSISTPLCVSLRFSNRASSSAPTSDTVARNGWPSAPYTSQVVSWDVWAALVADRVVRFFYNYISRLHGPKKIVRCAANAEEGMAGHSKWANIQHRKGRQDAKRGKIFTRLIKEITVASRLGGFFITAQPPLRPAVGQSSCDQIAQGNRPSGHQGRGSRKGAV